MYHNVNEKGISIILALLVLSAVLAIAFSVSSILLSELRFGRTVGHSVPAFFAADAGIEKILTLRNTPEDFTECISEAATCLLSNGAAFWVEVTAGGVDGCSADTYCIKSTGEFQDTRRAIEITY